MSVMLIKGKEAFKLSSCVSPYKICVATAIVERAFSAMKLIKSELRNRMDDDFLSSCMVPYVEKRIFNTISDESIMNRFQEMKTRRIEL
ncbi:hypothetical protein H5410_016654 [Solanum commersonii]|uniref:HAT C-terminal dimerisation domain-containing protein n=1 Tax=Solanum commersonii TaxID=4109 RepID=A0A9J5ZWY5_SOLCO|nr:hypothetical protein H5410_016654 [Solanum commersonii]